MYGTPVTAPDHQPPQIARANGIDLCYEIFGRPDAEPMVLIMGLGAQMIQWDDDFCRQLAARGLNLLLIARRAAVLAELAAELRAQHPVEGRTAALDLADASAAV